jgi:di/tricarboxylate transporter
VYLVTALMSEVLTNNAAAALMFPIAMKLATQLGIHPNIMSVAVMLGGSAGWILPYSYQCNLMVQAAGKYSTKDFIKVGVPLHVSNRLT